MYDLSGRVYDISGKFYNVSKNMYDISGRFYDVSGKFYDISKNMYDISGRVYDISGKVRDLYSSAVTLSGNKTFTGPITVTQLFENVFEANVVTGTPPTLTFVSTGNSSVIHATPAATIANNFSFQVNGLTVPSGSNSISYSFALILDVTNAKIFANTVKVGSGSLVTPYTSGGISSVTIDSATSFVMQQVNVMYFNGSATPTIFTSISQVK
jgi:hypothetical protein